MLTVGDRFPAFTSRACVGANPDSLAEISNDTHAGRWAVYVFYPRDFSVLCPTELVALNHRFREFQNRDCAVLAGSTDNEYAHLAWCRSHDDLRDLRFPLIAAQKLAAALGILDPSEGVCLRATFLVDPEGVIQFVAVNNLSVTRNVDEILRVIDAVQSTGFCPRTGRHGETAIPR